MWLVEWDETITRSWYLADRLSPVATGFLEAAAAGLIYALPIILLGLFFRSPADRLKSLKIILAALLAWQVLAKLVGTLLYTTWGFRDRPFATFGLQEYFFERPEKAFPSDHAAVIMAVTLAFFYYRYPKIAYPFAVLGVLVCLARVMIGFHYVGDILGGWLIGLAGFLIVYALDRPITALYNRFQKPSNLVQAE